MYPAPATTIPSPPRCRKFTRGSQVLCILAFSSSLLAPSRLLRTHPCRFEEVGCDYDALDLRGAFVNLGYLGVTEEALDRVLLDVAIATVDLYRGPCALHRQLRSKQLRHASLFGDAFP